MNWNMKSRSEQLFILFFICIGLFSVLCIQGCGGQKKSCEPIQWGKDSLKISESEIAEYWGVSIPGCGGICTPGRGCSSSCWANSCKISEIHYLKDNSGNSSKADLHSSILANDCRYYDKNILGCGGTEQSCYQAFAENVNDGNSTRATGLILGNTRENPYEIRIYIKNGCVNANKNEENNFLPIIKDLEERIGID